MVFRLANHSTTHKKMKWNFVQVQTISVDFDKTRQRVVTFFFSRNWIHPESGCLFWKISRMKWRLNNWLIILWLWLLMCVCKWRRIRSPRLGIQELHVHSRCVDKVSCNFHSGNSIKLSAHSILITKCNYVAWTEHIHRRLPISHEHMCIYWLGKRDIQTWNMHKRVSDEIQEFEFDSVIHNFMTEFCISIKLQWMWTVAVCVSHSNSFNPRSQATARTKINDRSLNCKSRQRTN